MTIEVWEALDLSRLAAPTWYILVKHQIALSPEFAPLVCLLASLGPTIGGSVDSIGWVKEQQPLDPPVSLIGLSQ